ncbi:hypothetical protein Rfer_4369 (plasmid) [Rhodoferax ferrireducens T118]|uniref:Uncharacterized protein n=1 Tax=Albidiferax ferrireducens (strain ATCC BAA-621 / DSM 15236 / T118) TaxID=338969 RepID=Q21Q90_ALBFT|nr:hypothetical protein [Rhodoferax ferrireducens]ABD72055.1 hypothetical protein Rfer_4369 [Rhodoferax ferrireducens T118]
MLKEEHPPIVIDLAKSLDPVYRRVARMMDADEKVYEQNKAAVFGALYDAAVAVAIVTITNYPGQPPITPAPLLKSASKSPGRRPAMLVELTTLRSTSGDYSPETKSYSLDGAVTFLANLAMNRFEMQTDLFNEESENKIPTHDLITMNVAERSVVVKHTRQEFIVRTDITELSI